MSLLIPSHALAPLSYRVPARLRGEVRIGTAVVAPLSGYGRLGIVVGFEEEGERSLKEVQAVVGDLELPASIVKLCGWAAGVSARPLQTVLRAALPPGLNASAYVVGRPAPGWPWQEGALVGRTRLRRALGAEGLKVAEEEERVALAPARRKRRTVEWATLQEEIDLPRRAHRQRALLETLRRRGSCPVAELLREARASRVSLKELVRRGVVRLERRPETAPVSYTRGSGADLGVYAESAGRALESGGSWVWRTPSSEGLAAAAAVARAAAGRGRQTLVLAPEVAAVERLVRGFQTLLPAGLTVTPYHSGLGRDRDAVYEAARRGEVDVVVGTRAAALVPVAGLGAVCVVDEPNEAHRAGPGYGGIPVHAREVAAARGKIEDATVVFLSPTPSLRLFAPKTGLRALPARDPGRWPAVRIVDARGSGAALSSAVIEACRQSLDVGERVGVVVNRLGHARIVSCGRCGFVWSCPSCGMVLAPRGDATLACARCGYERDEPASCEVCGSDRLNRAGLAVDRVRADLAASLDTEVGLLTAGKQEGEDAPVVVGTPVRLLDDEWDTVIIPDADSLLLGGGIEAAERAFRVLYRAAEVCRRRLLVQTRIPDHDALQAALRGDYPAFASAELERRRSLGYPPYAHLAEVVFEGREEAVRRAVESGLRPRLEPGVEMIEAPVELANPGRWRVLLRSRERLPVARSATLIARWAAGTRDGVRVGINVDPQEV